MRFASYVSSGVIPVTLLRPRPFLPRLGGSLKPTSALTTVDAVGSNPRSTSVRVSKRNCFALDLCPGVLTGTAQSAGGEHVYGATQQVL